MRVVVQNMEKLGISFSDPANSVCVTLVYVLCNLGSVFCVSSFYTREAVLSFLYPCQLAVAK